MTDSRRVPYSTPAAFDRAVTDRLRSMAAPHSPWPLADLKRQFAYDRLLVRLYQLDDAWVLKGATALLARGIAVRHTVGVDVYRLASARHVERDLRAALLLDAGDWFEFHAGASRPVADGATGVRIPITVRLGAREWPSFRVDVVADDVRMTGQPDDVPTLTVVAIPGLELSGYRAYPLVDHVADKVCAILERRGEPPRVSTRFRDLVDLVALVSHSRSSAEEQRRALYSEADRRRIRLPDRFDVPDVTLWRRGYAKVAAKTVVPIAGTLSAALAEVKPFVDPLLAGTATGTWDPHLRRWCGPPAA